MATTKRPARTNRRATAKRASADRPASDRFRKQAREVTQDLQQMGDIARDAAREKLGQLRGNASECYEQGRDKVYRVRRTFEQIILEHPLRSILIAAGAGWLVGRFRRGR
jgi:ElaB/YqjD/DUF883 family membrane-anchored ribosome-binding protein